MADKNETSAKTGGLSQQPAPETSADQAVDTSLLDQALMEADPDFVKSLSDIGPEINTAQVIDDESLDLNDLDAMDLAGEKDLSLSFRDRLTLRLRRWKRQGKQRLKVFKTQMILFVTETLPELGLRLLDEAKNVLHTLKAMLERFGRWSLAQKVGFFVMIFFTMTSAVVIYKSMHTGIIHEKDGVLIRQLDDFAEEVIFVEADGGYDSFYDSPRASQNLVSLKRMVFNIRPSSMSGEQPMAAVELFIEGYAPEVIIEIKDREAELLDLFQREGEQMSYDLLSSAEGKRMFSEKLQNTVNQVLTEGKVKKIFLKNFILKP